MSETIMKLLDGGLTDAYVIEAVYKYSQLTLEAADWPPHTIVNQAAWRDCARRCMAIIDKVE